MHWMITGKILEVKPQLPWLILSRMVYRKKMFL